MRSFLLLLVVDIAIVAGGIALFGQPRSSGSSGSTADESMPASRRLVDEARALRKEAERLEALTASRPTAPPPATRDAAPAATFPEDDLDRLEAALKAVQERRVQERAREGLRVAMRHVYPGFTEDQQRDVAEAIGAYRTILSDALMPGGAGIKVGYENALAELRRRLEGVVTRRQADEIVLRYAIKPGAPSKPPVVSPPIRRK